MSEMNILLLRRRKIHWGGKQREVQVIACRLLELLQVLGKTNYAVKTVTNSDEVEPAALENESLDEECSDNIEPACELACESDSGEDDNCDDAEYLHLPLFETTDKSINTQSKKPSLQHNKCHHSMSQLSPPLSFSPFCFGFPALVPWFNLHVSI